MKANKPKKINWDKYLFRASGISNIMAGTGGISEDQEKKIEELTKKKTALKELTDKQKQLVSTLSALEKRTDKQEETLNDLITKSKEVVGLTPNQQEELDRLIYKRDNLELSPGAKTYIRNLYREVRYNRRRQLKSKYLTKGIELEEEAIDMVTLYKGQFFTNNKERVNNRWLTGEVDILEGIDTKCSWSLDTFPFDGDPLDSNYYWQNMAYMDLHNAEKWSTIYCLIDATDSAIADFIYREGFNWKDNEIPKWKKLEILNYYIYTEENFFRHCVALDCVPDEDDGEKAIDIFTGFVPMSLEERIVEKETIRNDSEIELMHKMVELARIELKRLDR